VAEDPKETRGKLMKIVYDTDVACVFLLPFGFILVCGVGVVMVLKIE